MRIGGQCRRDLRAVLFAAWLLFGGLYVLPAARGDDGGGMIVPPNECPCLPLYEMVPPGCRGVWVCVRSDGPVELVQPGTPVVAGAGRLECNTCGLCCADVPSPTHCILRVDACDSREFSFSIDPGVEFGIVGIKAQLGAQFGFLWLTERCWGLEVGNTAVPPCTNFVYFGELRVIRDRVARMTHSYRWQYTWFGCEAAAWGYEPWCPVERTSTLASTWWADVDGKVQSGKPCLPDSGQKDSIR